MVQCRIDLSLILCKNIGSERRFYKKEKKTLKRKYSLEIKQTLYPGIAVIAMFMVSVVWFTSKKTCLYQLCVQDYNFLEVIVLPSQKLLHSIVLFWSWRPAHCLFFFITKATPSISSTFVFLLFSCQTLRQVIRSVTMWVISFDLSHTLTVKPAALTLIQHTSWNRSAKQTVNRQRGCCHWHTPQKAFSICLS